MTIYLFCYDSDMTIHSQPEPVKAFISKEAAQKFADEIYKVKHYPSSEKYRENWKIQEIELDS